MPPLLRLVLPGGLLLCLRRGLADRGRPTPPPRWPRRRARVPVAACATVCGKYLELPRSSAKSLTTGVTLTGMVSQAFGTPPTPAEARVRLVPAQYRGQPAWFGRYRSYTVDIARTGKPYLLAWTAHNGQALGFFRWDTPSVP